MSDYIPEEVLINILTRLPPKSLIRFRCVSKSWHSLISSPEFMSLYKERAILCNHWLIRRFSKERKAEIYSVHSDADGFPEAESVGIENPFRDLTRFYYRIVGSSNGVLCVTDDLFGHMHSIYLWNPVIRRRVTLPQPKKTFEHTWSCMCVLGFGFDAKNDDYKVVRVAYARVDIGYSLPPKADVYSLREGSWRGVSGRIPWSWMVDYFWSQAFVNGNVHWVAYRSNARRDGVQNLITVFDLSHEVFDEMPLPDALRNELPFNLNTAVLEQSLAVYQFDKRVWSESCSVWVMNKYRDVESWIKKFQVTLEGGIGMVLGVRRNGDVLLTARNGNLIAYNQDTGARMELGIVGTKESFYVCSHVENFALLMEGEEAREMPYSRVECDDDEDPYICAEKGELMRQSSMLHCLTSMIDGWFM